MHTNTAKTLSDYYHAYKRDELKNEPARLLCEHLDIELDFDSHSTVEAAIATWLGGIDLDELGDDGELGGVSVTTGIQGDIAEYDSGYDTTWVSAVRLLELADEAEQTGTAAPVPGWFEEDWKGMTQNLAENVVSDMSPARAVAILNAKGCATRTVDGCEEYKVGHRWFDDPKAALMDWLEDLRPTDRATALRSKQ